MYRRMVQKGVHNVLNTTAFMSAIRVYWHILYSKTRPPQRSQGWFDERYTCITASSCTVCINGKHFDTTLDDYIEQKKNKITKQISGRAISHGVLYEDSAVRLYEAIHGVKVHEAALIKHPDYPFMGASVDGFYIKYDRSIRCIIGGIIEIKIPMWRKDLSVVPNYYVDQMQFQMETLNMNSCEHLVCKIKEVHGTLYDYEGDLLVGALVKTNGITYYFDLFYGLHTFDKKTFTDALISYIRRVVPDDIYKAVQLYEIYDYQLFSLKRDRTWFTRVLPYFKAAYEQFSPSC